MYKKIDTTQNDAAQQIDNQPVQRQQESDYVTKQGQQESIQAKQRPVQRKQRETVQAKQRPVQRQANNTGLPDNLKSGIENLSGQSMDDVKVHYNSDKPAQLQAHAYAQGSDIHLASGQERHLPHEAWHVVQQKQGRVKPTMQMKGNVNINDNPGLEREADVMGDKAVQMKAGASQPVSQTSNDIQATAIQRQVVQREKLSGTLSGNQTFAIQDNGGRIALSGAIFHHMQQSILEAKRLITNTINILSAPLNNARMGMLRIAFGATTATQAAVTATLLTRYRAILAGLNTGGLVIKDESADLVNQGAEGHINSFLGFRFGPIHTRFDMSQAKTAFNLIHEGSHLWSGTDDILYMRTDWASMNTLWGIHSAGGGTIDNFQIRPEIRGTGHNNADSYAIFAYGAAGLAMP